MAQMVFEIGFTHKGMQYGWKDKELYRLPSVMESGKTYGLKKLSIIPIGHKNGYRCVKDKLTIDQLKQISHSIHVVVDDKKHKDLP